MNGTTPGWKTSEFWIHLASQATVLWAAVQGFIPPKYAAIITVAGSAVYTICRTTYKAYTDVKSATAPTVVSDAQTVVVNK